MVPVLFKKRTLSMNWVPILEMPKIFLDLYYVINLSYLFFFQTYIGDILVAVNPCKPISLYDNKVGTLHKFILYTCIQK